MWMVLVGSSESNIGVLVNKGGGSPPCVCMHLFVSQCIICAFVCVTVYMCICLCHSVYVSQCICAFVCVMCIFVYVSLICVTMCSLLVCGFFCMCVHLFVCI